MHPQQDTQQNVSARTPAAPRPPPSTWALTQDAVRVRSGGQGRTRLPQSSCSLWGQLSGPGRHNLSSSPGVALGSTGGFRQETQTRSQKHMSFWRQSHQVLWSWPGHGAYLWGEVQRGGRECWRGQGSEHQGLHEDLMHLRVLHQHHLHHLCVGGAWRAGHSSGWPQPYRSWNGALPVGLQVPCSPSCYWTPHVHLACGNLSFLTRDQTHTLCSRRVEF